MRLEHEDNATAARQLWLRQEQGLPVDGTLLNGVTDEQLERIEQLAYEHLAEDENDL